jgi:Fur family ferric uptake transcriptional regulator
MPVSNDELKKAGLKVTLPRLKVLQILQEDQNRHLGAEDVYKLLLESGEDVGLATVYRVLTQFEAAGLVARHHFEGGHSVFELAEEDHHDHIVCVTCGKVEEFHDEVVESRQRDIALEMGYTLKDHSHYLYGECKNCQLSR